MDIYREVLSIARVVGGIGWFDFLDFYKKYAAWRVNFDDLARLLSVERAADRA
jgi:hypothetical protein